MPVLRREQFDAIAHTMAHTSAAGNETGATFDSHTGHSPKSGLAVSLAGSGEPVPARELNGSRLQDYAQRYEPSLSRANVHQGVWVPGKKDPEHGTAWMDNTRVIPHGPNGETSAGVTEMMAQNERSAYNLDSGDQVDNMMRVTPKPLKGSGVIGEATGRGIANNIRTAQGRPSLESDESVQRSRARS